jgi:hypothetical protein
MFRYQAFIFLLFFLLIQCSSSKIRRKRKINNKKCDYGNEYIKGKCIKPTFNMIDEAIIDDDGIYKYIQIQCDKKYLFIRGRKDCKYHKNIFKKFIEEEIDTIHLDKKLCKVLGGGRIKTSKKDTTQRIFLFLFISILPLGVNEKYGVGI